MNKPTLILASLITFSGSASSQNTIPNAGFENWIDNVTYEDPQDWGTLNAATAGLGSIAVTKATATADVYEGDFALRLESLNVANQNAPGLATTGIVNIITQEIDGGAPFTARPVAIKGWYKYIPVNTDTASAEVILSRWNSNTQSRETIGRGLFEQSAAVAAFTEFTIPIDYTSSETPDTIVIVLLSSQNGSAQAGSVLFVDDLSIQLTATAINTPKKSDLPEFTITPNPTSDIFNLIYSKDATVETVIEIISPDGKQVQSPYIDLSISTGQMTLSANSMDLSPGIYFVRITQGNNSATKKLIKF